MTDICVIGGGASGMAAAIAARMENPDVSISILEKGGVVGKKLSATGNGRCNFSNSSCDDSKEILGFFQKLGIKSREEDQGRVYPYSGRAEDVLRAFELYLSAHNIEVIPHFTAESLVFGETGRITVYGSKRKIEAGKVLLATGGKAAPQFGCTGDGYKIAKEAGHSLTKIMPALSPVECIGNFEELKGVRAKASVSLLKKGVALLTEDGEVQFTDYGLSGICVFNLSRHIRLDGCGFNDYEIAADLTPDADADELSRELKSRSGSLGIPPGDLLLSLIPKNLSAYVLRMSGIKYDSDSVSDEQIGEIAHTIKNLKFTVSNVKGWKYAQCTSGGVPLCEINMDTMESIIARGLYFSGEIIDYDGPCGGYNLNNAWGTGIKAGKAMARDVQDS